jgi:hypothetical protein
MRAKYSLALMRSEEEALRTFETEGKMKATSLRE